MEAIREATQDVRVEATRPAIVVLRVGGERPTGASGNEVREQFRKSGAVLYVISTVGAQRPPPPQARGTDPVSVQIGQLRDDELADSASNLAQVLGDGARNQEAVMTRSVSTTLVPALERVAERALASVRD